MPTSRLYQKQKDLIPYITFREADSEGINQYYVLQKEFPHYVGRIDTTPIDNAFLQVPIAGHNLWLTFAGCLRGNMIPVYDGADKEREHIYQMMATWFYQNRILKEPKKYNKWKFNQDKTM